MSADKTCVGCGCTDSRACPSGCFWVDVHPDRPVGICSECYDNAQVFSTAARDVLWERWGQQVREGFTAGHDDVHANGQMAMAAAIYAIQPDTLPIKPGKPPAAWPWQREWWKPKDRRENLVRAAALLIAEIERLDRAAARAAREGSA